MYILEINPKAFIRIFSTEEIVINSDYKKGQTYQKIGDAMKAASIINNMLEQNIVKVRKI